MGANVNNNVTVNPSRIISGSGAFKVDGVERGSYQNGVSYKVTTQEMWIESDYALGKIDGERKSIAVQVSTELEEATIENIVMALGENTSSIVSNASSKTYEFIPSKTMIEHAISFQTQSASNKLLTTDFTCYRAVIAGGLSTKFMRGTKIVIPITFELLMNESGSYTNMDEKILA
jgi:hypothetical protein